MRLVRLVRCSVLWGFVIIMSAVSAFGAVWCAYVRICAVMCGTVRFNLFLIDPFVGLYFFYLYVPCCAADVR